MSERFELTEDGQSSVNAVMAQLVANETSKIMQEPFSPSMNTTAFMRKPSGTSDQGYRQD